MINKKINLFLYLVSTANWFEIVCKNNGELVATYSMHFEYSSISKGTHMFITINTKVFSLSLDRILTK